MGTARRTSQDESITRAVVKLDLEINFAVGAAPTLVAQGACADLRRDGPGAYTILLLDAKGKAMAPAYARELSHSYHFTNSSAAHVRWGNYNQALGALSFTIHADGAAATAAADPANAANLNLRIRLRFKNSTLTKN